MDVIQAIILGIVQGLTEFLPVSSSGHIIIGKALLGVEINPDAATTFEVVVHAATVFSTLVVFRQEILKLLLGVLKFQYNEETQYVLKIGISMIPILIVGLFFKDEVEALFGEGVFLVGIMLLVTAALLTLSFFKKSGKRSITYLDAFMIGIAQSIAVLPGLSRSGTTISTGLLLGDKKEEIAKFSFLMVLIPILGESFLSLIKGEFTPEASGISTIALISGFVAAFLAGLFACKVMINIVKRGKLIWFAVYCFIMGMISLIFLG